MQVFWWKQMIDWGGTKQSFRFGKYFKLSKKNIPNSTQNEIVF